MSYFLGSPRVSTFCPIRTQPRHRSTYSFISLHSGANDADMVDKWGSRLERSFQQGTMRLLIMMRKRLSQVDRLWNADTLDAGLSMVVRLQGWKQLRRLAADDLGGAAYR